MEVEKHYSDAHVRVGVALIVRRDGRVLLQKRKDGEYGCPGGHLELNETWAACALRELAEEVGPVIVHNLAYWTTVNVLRHKHYVVIFMVCDWLSGEPRIMEPEKCESVGWFDWRELPMPLMDGLQQLWDNYMEPF